MCASGRQFEDWSADYRLFSRERFCKGELFDVVRRGVTAELAETEPLVVGLDDTLLHKRGSRIPGVKWRRDPLGPPFRVNMVLAQRVFQMSAATPQDERSCAARMVPIDFCDAPTPAKPRPGSPQEQMEAYRREAQACNLPALASRRVKLLRDKMDSEGESERELWVVADGGYTNKHFLRSVPERVVFIGRIRGDARLYRLPGPVPAGTRGRKPVYGDEAGTPEAIRRDEGVPWKTARVLAAGKVHDFRVKEARPLLWRASGGTRLRLVVIAPLAYRPKKRSRLLYRKPAYLITNDLVSPVEKILQAYVWRWDVEVNFRDEKQLIGVGEAQVRSEASVQSAPAFAVASYAMLLLAAHRAFASGPIPGAVPPPKWRRACKPRVSTNDLIQQLRAELWGRGLEDNFSGFVSPGGHDTKREKGEPSLLSAVLYAA